MLFIMYNLQEIFNENVSNCVILKRVDNIPECLLVVDNIFLLLLLAVSV